MTRISALCLSVAVAALLVPASAWADCVTTTAVDGTVTITCGNTTTTVATNTSGTNAGTTANRHQFTAPINVNIASGTTISGFGLDVVGPLSGPLVTNNTGPVTITNNGTIGHTAANANEALPRDGLSVTSSGGLITYLGNGTVTTNSTAALATALVLNAAGTSRIMVGTQAAPISGTFSGIAGIDLYSLNRGIDAWFAGGTITATGVNTGAVALALDGGADVNLTMTGQTVVTGGIAASIFNGNDVALSSASTLNLTTNALITNTYSAGTGIAASGRGGGTNVTLTSGGSVTVANIGVLLRPDTGVARFTTAAGTTINQTGTTGALRNGVWFNPLNNGALIADLSGTINATGTGMLLSMGNGNASVTIRSGSSVSGDTAGIVVSRTAGATGVVDILNLGTITSANTAADFDGTLRIGDGNFAGTISGNIVNRGSLIFNRADQTTYGGVISGTGSLTKQGGNFGSGLRLTGANTYTGLTTIATGAQLILGNSTGGQNGSINGTSGVVNSGRLTFDEATAVTFSRQVSGSGEVFVQGTGAVTITSAQSYTGSTGVIGRLNIGAGGSIASSSSVGLLNAASELDISSGGNQTVQQLGGSGFVTLGSNTLTNLEPGNFVSIYSGNIRGAGNLIVDGTGSLVLDGTNSYTGTTTVRAGTLWVAGSTASSSLTTVASGATLAGNGTVGNTVVNGTLSPGIYTPTGTLTINGNLVFNAGSTFRVDVGATQAATDRVLVTGTATLAGSVSAFAVGGVFTSGSYTLLTANGGRTGTFSPLSTNPNATAALRYDANNVYLDINSSPTDSFTDATRQSLVFNAATVATNRSTAFSTQIVGRLLGGAPLYDQTFAAAFASTAVQNGVTAARAAITTAGGPGVIIGSPTRTASTTTSTAVTGTSTYSLAGPGVQTLNTVITIGPATVQVGALSTCNVSSLPSSTRPTCTTGGTSYVVGESENNFNTITTTTYTINETRTDTVTETLRETYELNGQVVAVGSVHAEVQSGLFDLGGRLLGRLGRVEAGSAGWADVYGFRVNQGARRAALGIAGGVGIGVAPGLTLALGIDRGRIDMDVAGALETGRVELTEIGAALRFDSGPFAASLALVQGFGNANTRRTIIGSSSARYDVRVTGVALDLGYAIESGGWTLRPEAGIDWVRLSTSAFTETDTLGLVVGGTSTRQVRATAGLSVGRDFGSFSLSARARYLAVLEGSARNVPVAFALAPTRSLTMSAPGEPNGVLLGARVGVPVGKRASLGFGYDGRLGGGYTSHTATASVRVAF
ncbi:S-layer family protein [Sphingomonas sp. SUN039]|uniref:beta strand repeat-containing protein n=1 Tax=Sphingomonas sp. SUN039 TaxID=2937787 RepID=UPI0021642873|nr:autotransporter domain-containing protein [Sphingomonas sp. SUN039]UVO54729.1 autotransporter domain-containing protein [Sphingomonas sp. SUN039]